MNNFKLRAALVLAASTLACATPTTGVVPLSDGLAKVTRQGSSALVSTASLKTAAIQEATSSCESKQKTIRVIDVKETQARAGGGWPEAEVLFKCD